MSTGSQLTLQSLQSLLLLALSVVPFFSTCGAVHPQNNYKFAIIGCGQIGVRITCELLRRGCRVFMWDNNAFRCQACLSSVKSILSSYRSIDAHAMDSLMKRAYTASNLAEIASSGCNVIIEAVPEKIQIKRQVFTSIIDMLKANAVSPEDVLICSNTISIPIETIVCGLDELFTLAGVWVCGSYIPCYLSTLSSLRSTRAT